MGFRMKARVDANQLEIVTQLRKTGAKVLHLHQLKNCVDILVGHKGKLALFEIKIDNKQKLSKGEKEFKDEWSGYPVYVATNIDEILDKF